VSAKNDARRKWRGMNWIRQERRLALYLRDGLACVWCGVGIEDGAQLSLDHVICNVKGGDNGNENLITCCTRCNSSRADRFIDDFAVAVAAYLNHGVTPEEILGRIRAAIARPVDLVEAKELLARRGGITAAVAARKEAGA